ncbi:hypothetical protein SAMN04488038_103191 [Solimonas aquatica]|uniref:YXWGXW repeat-containing protein n=1 Tax=Solimonas aquatica TaxID=489703 RepID=A0A1H9CUT9_9GAMM|nr:hypothetical protein [Solimonas aquatica]SEQ04992.1 hypothetical protein SAMN04488038_103191 [Solimonas aquatica]
MNKRILGAAALLLAACWGTAQAGASVSINVDQPGVFGQINIGGYNRRPEVVYEQPMIIQRPARYVEVEPIYLHVPVVQIRSWRSYCGRYNACGRPVYFVRDDWYRREYVPRRMPAPIIPMPMQRFDNRGPAPYGDDRGHHHNHRDHDDRDYDRGHDYRR